MYLIFLFLSFFFLWQIHRNATFIAESLSDYGIKLFLGLVSCIIPIGFLLSELNQINQPLAWGVGVNTLALLFFLFFKRIAKNQDFNLKESINKFSNRLSSFWKKQSVINKLLFGILSVGVGITTIANLIIFIVTVPNEWDSMTGHLVKCAYYLQNGNMNRLQGTTWTIDFYPNSLPTLQIFFYHVFGEKGFKVIHYLSYWVFVLTSYGISYKVSKSFSASLFAGLISALLPTALVQATTTETDIVLTAYLGTLTYLMFSFKQKPNALNISLISLITGIWIGHKVTFLLIAPAAFVVALHTMLLQKQFYQHIRLFLATFIIGILIYALPTGYIGNIKEVGKFSLGSLSAPPMVMQWHGVEDYSGKEKIENTLLNIGRYSSDFLNFDGIRSTETGKQLNNFFRAIPNRLFNKFQIEGDKFTVVSYFSFEHPIRFYLERPYWGIISFGLILPLTFFLLINAVTGFNKISGSNKSLIVLSIAAGLHFLSLSYSAPYDPIKARYFLNMAVWCMPVLALSYSLANQHKLWRYWQLFCSIIVVISGICIILFTRIHPVFEEKNIFNMNRLEQITTGRPDVYEAYKIFDETVPKDAIVALGTQQEHEDFEYPLWGKEFKRKLIPIHPFRSAVKPIPAEAEYLFYSKGVIPYQEGDIVLGNGNKNDDTPVEESEFFLRKLEKQRP